MSVLPGEQIDGPDYSHGSSRIDADGPTCDAAAIGTLIDMRAIVQDGYRRPDGPEPREVAPPQLVISL